MSLPHVNFTLCPIEDTSHLMSFFLKPQEGSPDWSPSLYKHYPELRQITEKSSSYGNLKEQVHTFLVQQYTDNKAQIEESVEHFQSIWNTINDQIITALANITETTWSEENPVITARVSLNPICPRFLKTHTFDVFYKEDVDIMQSVAIHEILHFFYFKKWLEIFPKTTHEEMEQPHLVWHLSEIVPGVILNDPQIQGIFSFNFRSYTQYHQTKIGGKSIVEHIQKFYDDRENFTSFLQEAWNFVQHHKETILRAFS
jgi:hypothetical protein